MKSWTADEIHFLRKWKPRLTARQTAAMINCAFDTDRTFSAVKNACHTFEARTPKPVSDGRFKPGHVSSAPFKKGEHVSPETEFKKGNRPKNTLEVGSEIVVHDGYVKVKLAEPNVWGWKHVIAWEKANGKRPKNHAIVFLDGDRTNCATKNLELVTRGELAVLNKQYKFGGSADPEIRQTLINLVRLRLTASAKIKKSHRPRTA